MPKNIYDVIVADCPWSFSDSLKMSDVPRGADANYSVMTLDKIKSLKVKDLASKDGAILALWVPSSMLSDGLDVMKSWGFEHKQTYIWVKTKTNESLMKLVVNNVIKNFNLSGLKKASKNWWTSLKFKFDDVLSFGMGRLFRQTHEICLIGINNKCIYKKLKNKSQRSVCIAENIKHSKKPESLQDSLDVMFPDSKKIELFARRSRSNWTCIGNEVCDKEDIAESIEKLLV